MQTSTLNPPSGLRHPVLKMPPCLMNTKSLAEALARNFICKQMPGTPSIPPETCIARQSAAKEINKAWMFPHCVNCEQGKEIKEMEMGKNYYGKCHVCGREVYLQSGDICHFCESQRRKAYDAGVSKDQAHEALREFVKTHKVYRGMRTAGLINWEKIANRLAEDKPTSTDKENLTVDKELTGEKLKIVHVDPPEDIKLTDFQPLEIIPDPEIVISLAGEPEIARLWASADKCTKRTLKADIINLLEAKLEVA